MSKSVPMKTFKPYEPDQLYLLPPSMRDWLPKDHLVHFISDVVDTLDLSAIFDAYTEVRGQPPYHPAMMVKVWLYAYSIGIRSSRKVERALYENIGFRILSGDQQPGYWALNDFRRRHMAALGDIFVQTVRLAKQAGLVSMKQVAVDGTKIKANASKNKAMSYKRMVEEEQRLRAEIDDWFKEADRIDAEEDRLYGDRRGDELPEHLNTAAKRLAAIQKAKAELEEEARAKAREEQEERRARAEAKGRTYRPRKNPDDAKPKASAQRNFTDPESRIMKGSDGFVQAFNAQAVVDTSSQIVVSADLSNQAADSPHLPSLLEQAVENTSMQPGQVLADAGYFSQSNLDAVANYGADALIPPDKMPHRIWREQQFVTGPPPEDATPEDAMRHKLRTREGLEAYKQRQMSVEPVFGQVKGNRGLRQFLHRGLEKARHMWRFDLAAHNILKMFRKGVQFGTAG